MKKNLTLAASLLSLVIAIALAVLSFLPVISVNSDAIEMGEYYEKGRYTKDLPYTEEYELGFGFGLSYLLNMKDLRFISKVQNSEDRIRELEEFKKDATEGAKESYQESIDAEKAIIEELEEEYGGAEAIAALKERLGDESFAKTVGTAMMIRATVTGRMNAFSGQYTSAAKSVYTVRGIVTIASLAFACLAMIASIITSFVCAIMAIVRVCKNSKTLGESDTFASVSRNGSIFAVMVQLFTVIYLIYAIGSGAGAALPYILAIILCVVSSLIRAAFATLAAEDKSERISSLIKNAITLVSVVSLIVFAFSMTGANLLDEFAQTSSEAQDAYEKVIYDQNIESGMDADDARSDAQNAAFNMVSDSTTMLYVSSLIFEMLIFVPAMWLTLRLGQYTSKNSKTGKTMPYGHMIVLSALILVTAVLPLLGTVSSAEERTEAYKSGEYVVLYDAYKYDDTKEKLEYEITAGLRDAAVEGFESIKENNDSDSEIYKNALRDKERLEAQVSVIETNESSSTVTALICAILLLACEIAYVVTPKNAYASALTVSERFTPAERFDENNY